MIGVCGRLRAGAGWLAAALAALLALGAPGGCHRTPAEQQIRHAIDSAATAARANDARGVLAVVSAQFDGNDGGLDRQGLRQLLTVRALRQDHTGILVGPVVVERRGDRMIATFNLVLTGGKPGDLLSGRAQILAVSTAWRREGGAWVCYQASWRRASAGD